MARFDSISDAVRSAIAAEAAPLIAKHDETTLGAPGQPMQLGSSLREEILTLHAIRGDEQFSLQPTGQTLSLLAAPGEHKTLGAGPGSAAREVGYVLAEPRPGTDLGSAPAEDWHVTAVSASDLAGRIKAALNWIELNVDGDPLVRIVTVPAYQVTALALREEEEIIGIIALPSARDTRFETNKVYSLNEFVNRLRKSQPAEGLSLGSNDSGSFNA